MARPPSAESILRNMRKQRKKVSRSSKHFGNLTIPNYSGDHSKGSVRDTPSQNLDIANKKYVDDQIASSPPAAHAATHENGGSDEISVAGLSGDLADAQDPKAHAASHHSPMGLDQIDHDQLLNYSTGEHIDWSDGNAVANHITSGKYKAATNSDHIVQLADAAGARSFTIEDSNAAAIFTINSNGAITIYGDITHSGDFHFKLDAGDDFDITYGADDMWRFSKDEMYCLTTSIIVSTNTATVAGTAKVWESNIPITTGGSAGNILQWSWEFDNTVIAAALAETDGNGSYQEPVFRIPYYSGDYNADWSGFTPPEPTGDAPDGSMCSVYNTNGSAMYPERLYVKFNNTWRYTDYFA